MRSTFDSLADNNLCNWPSPVSDPYANLQIPANHPLRSFIYGEGSNMMNSEVLSKVQKLGDNRVAIRSTRTPLSLDIARLAGGVYFVRDNLAETSTIYLNDNSKVKVLADGSALVSSASGVRTVKDSFLMASGDVMIKVNPREGVVHVFASDEDVAIVTSQEYWTLSHRDEISFSGNG